jgi:hypothetical protein
MGGDGFGSVRSRIAPDPQGHATILESNTKNQVRRSIEAMRLASITLRASGAAGEHADGSGMRCRVG